jgi:hypothetical protein
MADTRAYEKSAEIEENPTRDPSPVVANTQANDPEGVKQPIGKRLLRTLKTPGSALQIVLAAIIALAIGLAVSATVTDIPEAAPAILEIPGSLWLRALRATGEDIRDWRRLFSATDTVQFSP